MRSLPAATPIPERFATSEVARTSHLFLNFLSWLNFLAARIVYVTLEKQNKHYGFNLERIDV